MSPEWIDYVFSRYGAAVGIAVVALAVAGYSFWQLRDALGQLKRMRKALEDHTETDDEMMDGFRGTMQEIRDDHRKDQEHARGSRGRQYERIDAIFQEIRGIGERISRLEGRAETEDKQA